MEIEYTLVSANSQGRSTLRFRGSLEGQHPPSLPDARFQRDGNLEPHQGSGAICRKKGVAFLVDAAQTAGAHRST